MRNSQAGETEKQILIMFFAYQDDNEPFKEGIFPLGEIPFLLFYLRIRLYRTQVRRRFVFENFPSPSELLVFILEL